MVFQNMFSALSFLKYRRDDDFVDRLSYFYTSSFLIAMAVLVSFKQFGGRPLECWVPAHFTTSWEAYAEMYCWAQNTYWVPFERQIPTQFSEREVKQISYYQWVPFFLIICALLFYTPCMFWRLLNDKSGVRLHDIISVACNKEAIEPEYRARTMESLARHIEACLKFQHGARGQYTSHRIFKCLNLRYYECYVTGLYLVTKVLYLTNIFGNLLLINKFLETDHYSMYGFGVLKDLLSGRSWLDSGNFPRVTLCDFEIRVLGNIQRHTVQCVLVINIFTEKVFILIWMWYSLLFAVGTLDTLYWFGISLTHNDRYRFIMRHLELTGSHPETFRARKKQQVDNFLRNFIKIDGVFVLRMIAAHAGSMYCTELIEVLWNRFLAATEKRKPLGQRIHTIGQFSHPHHPTDPLGNHVSPRQRHIPAPIPDAHQPMVLDCHQASEGQPSHSASAIPRRVKLQPRDKQPTQHMDYSSSVPLTASTDVTQGGYHQGVASAEQQFLVKSGNKLQGTPRMEYTRQQADKHPCFEAEACCVAFFPFCKRNTDPGLLAEPEHEHGSPQCGSQLQSEQTFHGENTNQGDNHILKGKPSVARIESVQEDKEAELLCEPQDSDQNQSSSQLIEIDCNLGKQ